MRVMTQAVRSKIAMYIKNGVDISDLINGVEIKGENLSRAVIKKLKLREVDISGCDFSNAQIGCSEAIIEIIQCKMTSCNFCDAKFLGIAWIRSCNARNCNFKGADVHLCSYEHTNFLGSTFCNAVITIGTRQGIGASFPPELFKELTKGWNIEIEVKEKSKE